MKKAHFIGICGKGMSAVAALLRDKGYTITGSAPLCHPPVRDFLEEYNMWTYQNFSRSNISKDIDVVIAGASAALDRTKNEEVDEAHLRGIPVKTFPEVLAEITADKETLVVAGSYGKTTTTALITWLLHHAGKDPGYFIGETMTQLPTHGHIGESDFFVLEGDEYPTSGIDSRAKFLLFDTDNVLITSANHDHVNVFPTHDEYLEPFRALLQRVPTDGIILSCSDNRALQNLLTEENVSSVTYGLNSENTPDWSADAIQFGETTTFTLTHKNKQVLELSTKLLGLHNIQNIIGAVAFLLEKQALTPEEIAAGLPHFNGVPRRLERKQSQSAIPIYEGYGSSYDKARSAIEAIRLHFPQKRLVIIFEPHTFSWRNRKQLHWYDDVFNGAETTLIYKPPLIGVEKHEQVTLKEITERASQHHHIIPIESGLEGLSHLKKLLNKDDAVLLLTSGNLDGMIDSVPKLAEKLFPNEKI